MIPRSVILVVVVNLCAVSIAAAKPPPLLGGLAPAPAPPTGQRVRARSCAASPPIELGPTSETTSGVPRVAFGAHGGLAAWSPRADRLAVRPVDLTGRPTGPVIETAVPAELDLTLGLRALDGFYLALLKTSTPGRTQVLVLTPTGAAVGTPLSLELGDHMLDVMSPAAAHGVIVYAGKLVPGRGTARIVTVSVSPQGQIAQTIHDVVDSTDFAQGSRVFPQFSFSAQHAVAVLANQVIVDGQLRAAPQAPGITGSFTAPSFLGDKIQIVGFTGAGSTELRRYGTLSLSGHRDYERKTEAATVPARSPLASKVVWVTSPDENGGVSVGAGLDGQLLGPEVKLPWPNVTSGNETQIEWTGDQALVLYTAGKMAKLAPLPCK